LTQEESPTRSRASYIRPTHGIRTLQARRSFQYTTQNCREVDFVHYLCYFRTCRLHSRTLSRIPHTSPAAINRDRVLLLSFDGASAHLSILLPLCFRLPCVRLGLFSWVLVESANVADAWVGREWFYPNNYFTLWDRLCSRSTEREPVLETSLPSWFLSSRSAYLNLRERNPVFNAKPPHYILYGASGRSIHNKLQRTTTRFVLPSLAFDSVRGQVVQARTYLWGGPRKMADFSVGDREFHRIWVDQPKRNLRDVLLWSRLPSDNVQSLT